MEKSQLFTEVLFPGITTVHLVGIAGSGMSGIAEVLLGMGYHVQGSDLQDNDTTHRLAGLGAKVYQGHHADHVGRADVVVVSAAVKTDNPEIIQALKNRIPVIPRSEMLAELMRLRFGIAVAGAHGKTSTTAIIGHILTKVGLEPTIIDGGKLKDLGTGAVHGRGRYLVAEACESDGSFLSLYPVMNLITNIDYEHVDFYANLDEMKRAFIKFANHIPFYGLAVLCLDDPNIRSILPLLKRRYVTYGASEDAYYSCKNISLSNIGLDFTMYRENKELVYVSVPLLGRYNAFNTLGAMALVCELGVPPESAARALHDFAGVHRRLEIIYWDNDLVVVDDYGHHPTEIRVVLENIRERKWGKRLIVCFQPHRYSRTKAFAENLGKALSLADIVFLDNIYPAHEDPIEGVSRDIILPHIEHARVYLPEDHGAMLRQLNSFIQPEDVVLILGAGSIVNLGKEFVESLKKQ
jgi:UDP-N-acetylmuramate--alanine ligase